MDKFEHINEDAKIEVRSTADGKTMISGYAAVFNQRANIGGAFVEVIEPTAFDSALSDPKLDVVARIEHQNGLSVIGRTTNGTLKLSKDNYGLRYELTPPDTQAGRDIHTLVKDGFIKNSSFAFGIRSNGVSWDRKTNPPTKYIRSVNLIDIAPVCSPAYANTTCTARSKEEIPIDIDAEIELLNQSNADIRMKRFGK